VAKYEFWAKLEKSNEVIEIPDEVLKGLKGKELQDKLLEYHIKWSTRQIYGDWVKI
jgi:hypothetical protein